MIEILMFAFACAMLQGWINGGKAMKKARRFPSFETNKKDECGTFIYIDYN